MSALSAIASPGKTTYQAKIVKPDGYPLEASSVNFKFTILDPVGSCILYSETYSSVNMSSTGGLISFALGSGVKTYPASATTFEQVFSNITPSLSCDTGGPVSYSPVATDTRKIVMQFHDGAGWQTLPAMSINAVPYAMYANEATRLNGLTSSDFVQLSTVPTCATSEALRYTGASFNCIAVGNSVTSSTVVTALGYTPADGASLTTVTSDLSTVSSTVAGVSAYASSVSSTVFSVSSTVTSLQNSVAASFAAITSSQWTTSGTNIFYNTGNIGIGTTTPVTTLDVSGGVRIGAESTTCAPALAGTLRYNASNVEYCNGTSWQAFGVSGAGLQSFNGSTSGTQSFANATGGTAPAFNTSNGVHTLNIPLASAGSVTAGLISNTDYTTFSNKITSSAASIAQVLGYVPADNAASGTYAQKANNLSDLTNITTARTNLGLGTFATASSIDLGSASATGTLAIARLPSFTGDATIAAASNTIILSNSGVTAGIYTKVTVDTKGRVTSGSQITSGDVTTALGYIPANSATIVSSQWSTSGTNIFYNTGNVGIGTSTPISPLHISGDTLVTGRLSAGTTGWTNSDKLQVQGNASIWGTLSGVSQITNNNYSAYSYLTLPSDPNGWMFYTTNTAKNAGLLRLHIGAAADTANFSIMNSNVGIGTITPVTKLDVSGGVRISMESATCTVSYAGTLRYNSGSVEYCNGTTWSAFGVSGAGMQSFNGSTSGTQSFANGTGGTAPAFNTSNGVHTLNIPLASTGSVTAGLISNTDYTTFTNKITSSAASIAQVLGYVPADNAASGTYAQKANNLSDLTNIVTARTNLGLGTFATASSIDLGSASATGTLAIARLPSFTGDATIAAASNTIILSNSGVTAGTYTKVTVDSKGRVTSGAQIASSDVTTALGYTPANSATTVSSQWTTSGTTINYMNGSVGIGTTSPQSKLEIRSNTDARLTLNRIGGWATSPADIKFNTDDAGTDAWTFGMAADSTNNMRLKYNANEFLTVLTNGNVGIGATTAPTAKLHLASGTISVAPLKFTSGTLLTSPQAGVIEYDGANFYLTDSTNTRRAIAANANPGTYDNVSNINSSGNITMTPVGSVVVSSTTASTNSSTGALVVKGGLGVAGNIYTSGTIVTSSNIQGVSVTATSGMISPYIAGSVASGGSLTLDSTTHATKGNILLAPNGGNVGIGTSTPEVNWTNQIPGVAGSRFFTLTGGVSDIPAVQVWRDTNSAFGGYFNMLKSRSGGPASNNDEIGYVNYGFLNSANKYKVGGSLLSQIVSNTDGSETASLVLRTATSGTVSNVMTLVNGNVGVGTSTPANKLDVVGGNNSGLRIKQGNQMSIAPASSTSFYNGVVLENGGSSHAFALGYTIGGYFGLNYFDGTSAYSNLWTITNSGNMGIGTSSPNSKLDVAGQAWFGVTNKLKLQESSDALSLQGTLATDDNQKKSLLLNAWGGNVGIGTTTPGAKLEINDGSNTSLQIIPSGGVAELRTINKSGGYYSARYDATQHIWNIAGTEKMRIDPVGNVGIGTSSPGVLLDLVGGSNQAIIKELGTGSTAASFFYNVSDYTGISMNRNPETGVFTDTAKTHVGINLMSAVGNSYIAFSTASTNNTLAAERMRIDKDGNVGIGTTAPNSLLQVSKDDASGFVRGEVTNLDGASADKRIGLVAYGSTSTDPDTVALETVGASNFRVYHNGQTRLKIDSAGNVGIGTTSPAAKLHVSGRTYLYDGNVIVNTGMLTSNSGTNPLIFGINEAEKMRIDTTGNVGIGTTAPTQALEVNGRVQSFNDYYDVKTFTDGWAIGDYAEVVQASPSGAAGNSNLIEVTIAATRGNWVESATHQLVSAHSESDVWREVPASSVNYYTTFSYRCFTVDANGVGNNVKFRIRAIRASTDCSASSSGSLPIYFSAKINGYNNGWTKLTATGTGATVTGFRSGVGSEWNLYTGASRNAGLPTITAKEGNVGIGTNNPGVRLEVSGGISTKGGEIIMQRPVTAGGWARGLHYTPDGNYNVTASGLAGIGLLGTDTTQNSIYLAFGSSPWASTTGIQILSSGNVGIGTTSPSERLHVVGNLRVQGSTDCTLGNGAAGTNCSSDARLKENIKPIPYALEKIVSLKGVEFDWNAKSISHGRHDIGVIAQDVEKVFPSAVIDDKNTGYKKVDYAVLVAPLIQAVKELYVLIMGEKDNNTQQARQIAQTEDAVKKLVHENQELKTENAELKVKDELKTKQLNDIRAYLCAKDSNAPICK